MVPAYTDIYNTFVFQYNNTIEIIEVISDSVKISVGQIAGINSFFNSLNPETSNINETVYFQITLINQGNYYDTFLFSCTDSLNLTPKIFIDSNFNNVLDAGDYLSDTISNIYMNDSISIIIALFITSDKTMMETDTIYFMITSLFNASVKTYNIDTFSIINRNVIVSITTPENNIDTIEQIINISGTIHNAKNNDTVFYFVNDILQNTGIVSNNDFSGTVTLNGINDVIKVIVENSYNDTGFDTRIINYVGLPQIEIISPDDNHNTNINIINISGTSIRTLVGDTIEIFNNSIFQSKINLTTINGNWTGTVSLSGYGDSIMIKLTTKYNQLAYDTITVNYFSTPNIFITFPANNFCTNVSLINIYGSSINTANYDSVILYVNNIEQSRNQIVNNNWSGTVALSINYETITALLITFLGDTAVYEINGIYDTEPPIFYENNPETATTQNTTIISIKYIDNVSGIDISKINIKIDSGLGENDFTSNAHIYSDSIYLTLFIFTNDTYIVTISAYDNAGNIDTFSWQFLSLIGYKVSGNLLVEGRTDYSGCSVYLTNNIETYTSTTTNTGYFEFHYVKNGTYILYTYLKSYLRQKIENIIISNNPLENINVGVLLGGDLNNSGKITTDDLIKLKMNLGRNVNSPSEGDINNSGWVTIDDYTILIKNLNKSEE